MELLGTLAINVYVITDGRTRQVRLATISYVLYQDCEKFKTEWLRDNPHIKPDMVRFEWSFKTTVR